MYEQIFKWSKVVALLCIIPITVFLCLFLNDLRTSTKMVSLVATKIPVQITDVQNNLNKEVNALSKIADDRIEKLTRTTDSRLASIQKDLNNQLTVTNTNLNAQLTVTNSTIVGLTNTYATIPQQVAGWYKDNFDEFTNCKTNKLCLQGQASDTLFAVRTTSRDTSTAMASITTTLPVMEGDFTKLSNTFAHDVPVITDNISGITLNIKKLTTVHWYDRVLGYAINSAVLYRNLFPVTNLAVTGAQMISSH